MTGLHDGSRTRSLTATTESTKDSSTASELKRTASEKTGNLRNQLSGTIDGRREHLASTARSVQEKAQEFAHEVRDEQPQVGNALESVAESAGSVISYVERTPLDQMTHDLSRQMRERPMLFAAGLFGAGFALARLTKPVSSTSSSSGRQDRSVSR